MSVQPRIVTHFLNLLLIYFFACVLQGEDEMETTDTPLALFSVDPDSTGSISLSPENISIVIEDEVVMGELPKLADAFMLLFGLIYALHLDYPKKLTHTFTFIQKMLLCLDDNKPLKPCLLSLKNDLLKDWIRWVQACIKVYHISNMFCCLY